jgi:hypothetical protein
MMMMMEANVAKRDEINKYFLCVFLLCFANRTCFYDAIKVSNPKTLPWETIEIKSGFSLFLESHTLGLDRWRGRDALQERVQSEAGRMTLIGGHSYIVLKAISKMILKTVLFKCFCRYLTQGPAIYQLMLMRCCVVFGDICRQKSL